MPRIDSNGEVRPCTEPVGRIDGGVEFFVIVRAYLSNQIAAGRKSEHANFAGIDMPLLGVGPYQAHVALSVFERLRRNLEIVRSRIGLPFVGFARNSILLQYTGNAFGHK